MGEFSPPPPFFFLNHADAQTSNNSTRLWFYYIITKIHSPLQNPGSVPEAIISCITLILKSQSSDLSWHKEELTDTDSIKLLIYHDNIKIS